MSPEVPPPQAHPPRTAIFELKTRLDEAAAPIEFLGGEPIHGGDAVEAARRLGLKELGNGRGLECHLDNHMPAR